MGSSTPYVIISKDMTAIMSLHPEAPTQRSKTISQLVKVGEHLEKRGKVIELLRFRVITSK